MASEAPGIPVEQIATPGPSPNEACDECGGDPNPEDAVSRDESFAWCCRFDEVMDSEEKVAFDAWAEAVRQQLIADRVGGLCEPIEPGGEGD